MSRLTQPGYRTSQPPGPGSGLEIIEGLDHHFAEQGIVRVESINLTDSGHALYEINRSFTDGSLDEVLSQGILDPEKAVLLALEALHVVNEMRRMGLDAHGDIKPQNIFVDERHHTAAIGGFHTSAMGEKALEAFGVDVSHIRGADGGNYIDLSYTAPEVVLGATPDTKSDVYEGARTLMHALSGVRPSPTVKYFDDVIGNGLEAVRPPDLNTEFPVTTPNATRFAIQQALNPNPDERQSMEQLVEEVAGNVYPWVRGQETPPNAQHN